MIDAHGFDLYDEPMPTIANLEAYATATQAVLVKLAGQILGADAPEALMRHAGIAQTFVSILRDFALHAARRQLYLPLDVLARHGAERETIFAGQADEPLRAALAEMRKRARNHLAAAGEHVGAISDALLPALLPLALIRPTLRLMERSDYEPFRPQPLPPWRRQWLLWRAARDPRRIFQ